jgi:hypothetical protein
MFTGRHSIEPRASTGAPLRSRTNQRQLGESNLLLAHCKICKTQFSKASARLKQLAERQADAIYFHFPGIRGRTLVSGSPMWAVLTGDAALRVTRTQHQRKPDAHDCAFYPIAFRCDDLIHFV